MTIAATNIETARRASPPADLPPELTRAQPQEPAPSVTHKLRRRLLQGAVLAAVLGAGSYFGWQYWTVWQFHVATDDAYVQADVVAIAPQVAGNIASLLVGDNEQVKTGQVLAVIDQRDYQAAVDQAKASVQQAEAAIATNEAEIAQQQAVIAEVQATIEADKAAQLFAQQNNQRYGALAHDGYGSVQNAQQAASATATATATVAKDQAAFQAAQKQVATLNAQLAEAKATLAGNQAMLQKAEIDLGYTTITAPVDGVIGNRTLRVGQYVQPGTDLLAVVPLAKTYVVANYKETQLEDVRAGQPAELAVDTFPDKVVHGFVDSLAPASGEVFALLPPDNATGNFTKIVQRIPVKIDIDQKDPLAGLLRPGMSVTATIDVGTTPARRSAP